RLGRRQSQVVRHAAGQQFWLLGQIADASMPGATVQRVQRLPIDQQFTLIGQKSEQCVDQGGFTAAAGPLQQQAVARLELQAQRLQTSGNTHVADRKVMAIDRKSTRLNSSHVKISY